MLPVVATICRDVATVAAGDFYEDPKAVLAWLVDTQRTRVTVEHIGWDAIPTDNPGRHKIPLATFQLRFAEWWGRLPHAAFPPG